MRIIEGNQTEIKTRWTMTTIGGNRLLTGLSLRSMLTDCPLGAFKVTVKTCNANGDCVNACMVNVFEKGPDGRCTVINDDLCFGCTACLAQCLDEGVAIEPREPPKDVTLEELLE